MKANLSFLASTACALLLALPLAAANGPATKANSPVTATTAMRTAWPSETLSGKITMVDPAQKLLVVQTSDGIPFDMLLTGRTRIRSGDQSVTLQDLSGDTNKTVSVKFTPERRGDVAQSINIGG
jgi:hypothetical protein